MEKTVKESVPIKTKRYEIVPPDGGYGYVILFAVSVNYDGVAWAFSLIGFGDIATRVLLIFSSSWLNRLGSHFIYVIGVLLAVLTKLAMLLVKDYVGTLVIFTIMGISRCVIMVLFPLVVADSVRPEQFPSAMGMSMMICGLSSLIMGPIIGAIRDATGNYTIMFLILTALMAGVAATWTVELVCKQRSSNYEMK